MKRLLALFCALALGAAAAFGQSLPWPGPGAASPPLAGPTLTYVTSSTTGAATGSVSSITFSSVSLGTAAANRTVIVGACYRASTQAIASVTVAGNTATQVQGGNTTDAGGRVTCVIYSVALPTGATGNIVISLTGTDNGFAGIGVWAAYGLTSSTTPTGIGGGISNSGSQSLSANTSANGMVVAVQYNTNSINTVTYSGLTSDFNIQPSSGSQGMSGASASGLAASSPYAMSVTFTGGSFATVSISAAMR